MGFGCYSLVFKKWQQNTTTLHTLPRNAAEIFPSAFLMDQLI